MKLEFSVEITDEEGEKLKIWKEEQLKKCKQIPGNKYHYTYFEYTIRSSAAGDFLQVTCLPTKERMIIDGFNF